MEGREWRRSSGNPGPISVQLIRVEGENSEPIGEKVQLSVDNDWKHTYTDLPTVVDGKLVGYSVVEDPVEGFTSTVEVNLADGTYQVLVTNTQEPETPEPTPPDPTTPEPTSPEPTTPGPDEPVPSLPKTGVDIFYLLSIAAGTLAAGVWMRYRHRKN